MNRSPQNVIIAEDDTTLRMMLVYGLSLQGITAIGARDAADLWDILNKQTIDIIVLDIGLPDEDGISVATRLQQTGKYGVILVTGRNIDSGSIQGVADRYFVKPVDIAELALAIKNIRKTTTKLETDANTEKQLFDWQFCSTVSSLVTPAGILVRLTQAESTILKVLTKNIGECVPRSELLSALGFLNSQSFYSVLEDHINTIRSKVEKSDPDNPVPIIQRYGQGYIFLQDKN